MNKNTYRYISQQIINKNNFNTSDNLGRLTQLINESSPNTIEEWEEYYHQYILKTGIIKKINQNLKYIEENYKDIDMKDVKEVFRKRTIQDVWEGWARELSFKKIFEENSTYEIQHTDYRLDSQYGVDFIVYFEGVMVGAFQVKPISYIYNNKNYVLIDKQRNQRKYQRFLNDYGIPVYEVGVENGQIKFNKEKVEVFYNK